MDSYDVIRLVLGDGEYHPGAEVIKAIRAHDKCTRPQAQKPLFRMVKEGSVVWNRVMGSGAMYRLLSAVAAASSATPLPRLGGAGSGEAPHRDVGVEAKNGRGGWNERMARMCYVRLKRWWPHKNDDDGADYLPDTGYLRWLMNNGYVVLNVTPLGRQWAGQMKKAGVVDDE